jgi:hypothetical protein
MRTPSYERVQILWSLWILMAVTSGGLLALAQVGTHRDAQAAVVLVIVGIAVPCATLIFLGRFVVALDQHHLTWRFGYLGFPRWQVAMDEITAVEPVRTTWLDGWGIHRTKEGWLYNASGFGAVRIIMRDGRQLRLGSDEPQRLAAFIHERIFFRP